MTVAEYLESEERIRPGKRRAKNAAQGKGRALRNRSRSLIGAILRRSRKRALEMDLRRPRMAVIAQKSVAGKIRRPRAPGWRP